LYLKEGMLFERYGEDERLNEMVWKKRIDGCTARVREK